MTEDAFKRAYIEVHTGRRQRAKTDLSLFDLNGQLGNAVERHHAKFTPEERDMVTGTTHPTKWHAGRDHL